MSEPYGSYHPQTPQAYGQPYPMAPQEHPQGTTVLVLGILGLFFGVCAPFAWYLGNKALRDSRTSGVVFTNQQSIVVGRILGLVISILAIVSVVLAIVFLIVLLVLTSSS